MGNEHRQQCRQVALWNDRPVITLNESFGRDRIVHGIVLGPRGMSFATALRRLDEVFRAAVVAESEEWNYDDVIQRLSAEGFEETRPAEWWEGSVELSDD
jgi:hypothetical protein